MHIAVGALSIKEIQRLDLVSIFPICQALFVLVKITSKKKNDSCVTFSIQGAPPQISTGTFIALGVGLAALVGLAVLLAFLLKKSKSTDDILLNGKNPFETGMAITNPLHEPDKKVFQNQLFKEGGEL